MDFLSFSRLVLFVSKLVYSRPTRIQLLWMTIDYKMVIILNCLSFETFVKTTNENENIPLYCDTRKTYLNYIYYNKNGINTFALKRRTYIRHFVCVYLSHDYWHGSLLKCSFFLIDRTNIYVPYTFFFSFSFLPLKNIKWWPQRYSKYTWNLHEQ